MKNIEVTIAYAVEHTADVLKRFPNSDVIIRASKPSFNDRAAFGDHDQFYTYIQLVNDAAKSDVEDVLPKLESLSSFNEDNMVKIYHTPAEVVEVLKSAGMTINEDDLSRALLKNTDKK